MKTNINFTIILLLALCSLSNFAQTVTTFAGSTFGFANGTGTAAQFLGPQDVASDYLGNLYVADTYNHVIRKITPSGIVTTVAGSTQGFANGIGAAAKFDTPFGIAVNNAGTFIIVADTNNNKIRQIAINTGMVTTIAGDVSGFLDGSTSSALFNAPKGIDIFGTSVYVADTGNNKIRKIDAAGVSTIAGTSAGLVDGPVATAKFFAPTSLVVNAAGEIFIADTFNHRIRRIAGGQVNTFAGSTAGYTDATGINAKFTGPDGILVDPATNTFYVSSDHKIRKITSTGVVTTLAGSTQGLNNGTGLAAQFNGPKGLAFGTTIDKIFVAENGNHQIRLIDSGPLSNSKFEVNDFSIYPNPSNGIFTIKNIENKINIVAYDILGKEVAVKEVADNQFSIENKGINFLKIISDNGKITNYKLIIK